MNCIFLQGSFNFIPSFAFVTTALSTNYFTQFSRILATALGFHAKWKLRSTNSLSRRPTCSSNSTPLCDQKVHYCVYSSPSVDTVLRQIISDHMPKHYFWIPFLILHSHLRLGHKPSTRTPTEKYQIRIIFLETEIQHFGAVKSGMVHWCGE
jgi:hypothetical protein